MRAVGRAFEKIFIMGAVTQTVRMQSRLVLPSVVAVVLLACSGVAQKDATDGGADPEGGAVPAEGGVPRCTPGNYVFCRCSDRTEGTKQCRADGLSFDPCATSTGPCP